MRRFARSSTPVPPSAAAIRSPARALFAVAALGLSQLALPATGHAQVSAWAMSGQNPQHTGFTADSGPSVSRLDWISGALQTSPVAIGEDALYTCQTPFNLNAVGFDGGLKWHFPSDAVHGPAVASDGTVYFGGKGGKLYAVDPHDPDVDPATHDLAASALKWSYQTGGEIDGSPTIAADGSILVTSGDRFLYQINPNGTLRRKFTPANNAEFQGNVALALDGTIYAKGSDYNIYAFKPDGALKWKFKVSNFPNDIVLGDDGVAYVATADFKLWALKPNGTKKWSVSIGTAPKKETSVCYNQPGLDPISRTIFVGGRDGLYGYTYDGAQKWKLTFPDNVGKTFSRPAIGGDGTIYITRFGGLYAVNASNGALLWSRGLSAINAFTDPAIDADGSLYVAGNGIHRFHNEGRERPTIYTFESRAKSVTPPTSLLRPGEDFDLRVAYVIDTDGAIAKVELYLDDGDGEFDPDADEKIGDAPPAVPGGNGYRLYYTPPEPGEYRFFAVATDSAGKQSNVAEASGFVLSE